MDERQIHRGIHGSYHWLTSTEGYSGTLLRVCPEIVVGRYVAVTSTDSGVLRLSEEQQAAGWESRNGIAYSQRIDSTAEIPHQRHGPEAPGFDEFYVSQSPLDLGERSQGNIFLEAFAPMPGRTVVFVNWPAFVLHDPDRSVQTLLDLFWPQLERLQPESYVADTRECLTFVSKRLELAERLHTQLASIP